MAQKQPLAEVKRDKIVFNGPGPLPPVEVPRVLKEIDGPDEIEINL